MNNKTIWAYIATASVLTLALIIYFLSFNLDFSSKVDKVKKVDFTPTGSFSGVVENENTQSIYIKSPAIIEDFFIKKGDFIKKGENLLSFSEKSKIDLMRELKIIQLDINEIEIKLDTLEHGRGKLELDSKSLEIQDIEDQIKATTRKIPILENEAISLNKRAQTLKTLFDMGGISSIEYNRAFTDARKKESDVEDLKMNLSLLKQKYSLLFLGYESLKRDIKMQKLQLESSLAKLNITKEELKEKLEEISKPLASPVTGIILNKYFDSGSKISPGERILSIGEDGYNVIKISVPVSQISIFDTPLDIKIIDTNNNQTFSGKVQSISNIVNNNQSNGEKTFTVDIKPIDEKNLSIGTSLTINATGEQRKNILVIKPSGLVFENGDTYLYTFLDNKYVKTPVTLGKNAGEYIEVLNLPEKTKYLLHPHREMTY